MKREDQISEAALDYCFQDKNSKCTNELAAFLAFCEGVRWADENPKTSTLAEASRNAPFRLKTQMEYEDHRCDKTLYGHFQELLNTLGAMTGYSNFLHLSQNIKEKKSRFNVYFSINNEGTINIHLELVKAQEE